MQYNAISTNYILLHGIIRLVLDRNPSRRRFRTARPGEKSISAGGSATSLGAGSY